ncbi:MAG TPA: class I mannose-6-phosphate isomerase [Sphingomicrobium sp.]
MKLKRKYVEKPWGRTSLPAMFDPPAGEKIGEVWYEGGGDLPLLAKYIFTSEALSIQVHPNDDQARERGLASGKTECWYILDAEPGAVLGVGLKHEVQADALREAALDGSIEQMIAWHPVGRGDFVYVPAGTIHAIGPGISLLEFQQNADVTYRLYDYGRPRELHLDDGMAVAAARPIDPSLFQHVEEGEKRALVDRGHFALSSGSSDVMTDRKRWVMPIRGTIRCGSEEAGAGDVLLAEAGATVDYDGAWALTGTTL